MLGSSDIVAFIPTRDAVRAREFYTATLGLHFVSDDTFALVFDANGTTLRIARAGAFTPMPFTVLGWAVTEIDETVRSLIGRGVQFELYDFLQQDRLGIWDAPGGTRVAWFKDPDGNLLSVSQHA